MLAERVAGLEARVIQMVGRLRALRREAAQSRQEIAELRARLLAGEATLRELREENRALRAGTQERDRARAAKVRTIRQELETLLARLETAGAQSGRGKPSSDGEARGQARRTARPLGGAA